MPTSVLLAVLAAAGLLALAPAMVRRYDATERLVAERALSTARVLIRCGTTIGDVSHRRQRTVPGRYPVNPPRSTLAAFAPGGAGPAGAGPGLAPGVPATGILPTSAAPAVPRPAVPASAVPASGSPVSGAPASALPASGMPVSGSPVSAGPAGGRGPGRLHRTLWRHSRRARRRSSTRMQRRHAPAVYRRRRVFAALVLLNTVELVGVFSVGPSFWIGFAVSGALLFMYLIHLRNRALADARRRRAEARRQAQLAALWEQERQAYQRRLAARREALRRAAQARAAAQREAVRLSQRYGDWDALQRGARRSGPVRGKPYSQRAAGF